MSEAPAAVYALMWFLWETLEKWATGAAVTETGGGLSKSPFFSSLLPTGGICWKYNHLDFQTSGPTGTITLQSGMGYPFLHMLRNKQYCAFA